MAIITLNPKRKSSGSYVRLIGNKRVADLVTAIHAASISTGTQVTQKLIKSFFGDLPIFHGKDVNSPSKTLKVLKDNPNGVIIFNGFFLNSRKQEVDVILYVDGVLYCYEIKDGNNLDTKKSKSEIDVIENAEKFFKRYFSDVNVGIVSIHMTNGVHKIKDERADKYVLSGVDFCNNFNFNFDVFCELQNNEQPHNLNVILDEMAMILNENRPYLFK